MPSADWLQRHITTSDDRDLVTRERLAQIEIELDNLSRNMLAGVLSPTLIAMLGERESEKAELEARLAPRLRRPSADILPHPALLALFRQKVTALRESIDDDAVRPQAAATLRTLIESVTIYPDSEHGPEAEVVAKVVPLR